MGKCGIKKGEIRFCEEIKEEYLVLGRTPYQKRAFRVLWKCGLRSHDMIDDIQHDKIVAKIENFRAKDKNMVSVFMRRGMER